MVAWEGAQVPNEWIKPLLFQLRKGRLKIYCKNYSRQNLLSKVSEMFGRSLNVISDPLVGEEDKGFRKGRWSVDQNFAFRK